MKKRKYINHNSKGEQLRATGKADALVADGAVEITERMAEAFDPENLVAVVENDGFEAALHVENIENLRMIFHAKRAGDRRHVRWLIYKHATELAGREYDAFAAMGINRQEATA